MAAENGDSWRIWSKHVLKELERLNETLARLEDRLNEVQREIAVLKFKSGLWGAAGASLPVVGGLLVMFLKK